MLLLFPGRNEGKLGFESTAVLRCDSDARESLIDRVQI